METNDKLVKRVAHLNCCSINDIDMTVLKQANSAFRRQTNDYWDAMANANQLHGNPPDDVCIAIVYSWLME